MQARINQERLAKGLNYVSKAVSNKPNIPVLSNVLINFDKDGVNLAATNLDMGITMWIPALVESEGRLTVSGKFLADFINATGGDKVDFSQKGDVLLVKTEDSQAEFRTIDANEFPVLPKVEGEAFFTIPVAGFIEAMEKVIFACATDLTSSKIQYTGVLFELEAKRKDSITFVGLNGYRLSRKVSSIKRVNEESMQLIVPARSLQELVKVLSSEDEEELSVFLSSNKSQIIFKFGEIEISIRLLEGPYPEYKAVIPSENAFGFEVGVGEFERALKIMQTFARSIQGNKVNWDLDMETGTLLMHTEVVDLGRNQTKLLVQNIKGSSDLKDAYSLQFLMDMLNHFSGENIKFETNAPLAAAVFTGKDDADFVHLVMPVQRDD